MIIYGKKFKFNGAAYIAAPTANRPEDLVYCYVFEYDRRSRSCKYQYGQLFPQKTVAAGRDIMIQLDNKQSQLVNGLQWFDSLRTDRMAGGDAY